MTLGEKIKVLRSDIGLTQEQLANKLGVSRQAITKWESDKGIPDIDNLKAISKLMGVSIDSLVDNDKNIENIVVREDIKLEGKGRKKVLKDRIIKEKYPNATIYTLIGKLVPTKSEKIIGNVLGFFTDAPFGIPDMINSVKNLDKEFYLVEDQKTLLVMITDEYMETREIDRTIVKDKFIYNEWEFIKCKYEVKGDIDD